MGYFSEKAIEIQEMLFDGATPEQIASAVNMSVEAVEQNINELENADYDESMDGDFDSAIASAGFGTDEDYGYYGEE